MGWLSTGKGCRKLFQSAGNVLNLDLGVVSWECPGRNRKTKNIYIYYRRDAVDLFPHPTGSPDRPAVLGSGMPSQDSKEFLFTWERLAQPVKSLSGTQGSSTGHHRGNQASESHLPGMGQPRSCLPSPCPAC